MDYSSRVVRSTLPIILVTFAACGGASDAGAPRAPPAASTGTLAPGEWASWTHDQKAAYMKSTVLVQEKPLFAEYDATRFADLTCKSCHGASADEGSFKMPNPALPKLVPGKIIELGHTKPKVFEFMAGVLVPRTARLLGQPVFDHSTKSGFGCFNCHTVER